MILKQPKKILKQYTVGDRDTRPWGEYIVTAVGFNMAGEEFCEKEITVNPGKILSLQSHELRRERWTVKEGILTVVLNGSCCELQVGESIDIPLRAIHCMANVGPAPCVVHERQEGICREEDIIRYVDAYGRGVEGASSETASASIKRYEEVLKCLHGKA